MNTSEYKILLEKLLEELKTVLEACTYHAKRKHRISVSERLESARTAAYIVSLIQQLTPLLEQISRKLAEEEAKAKSEKSDNYKMFLMLAEEQIIEIKNQERLKKMCGIKEIQDEEVIPNSPR